MAAEREVWCASLHSHVISLTYSSFSLLLLPSITLEKPPAPRASVKRQLVATSSGIVRCPLFVVRLQPVETYLRSTFV